MVDGQPVPGSLFVYAPNNVAPVLFTVSFAISAVGHNWQCYRHKCFKLLWLHSVCAVLFTIGFALREYAAFNYTYFSHKDQQKLIVYILSQVFIYVCPPLLELSNYHILGRVFYYVPYLAPLPPSRVLATFGGLMGLVEALNALGVAFASNPSSSQSQQEMGGNLTIASLAIQLSVIATFYVLAAIFYWRCSKAGIHSRNVATTMVTLYVSMFLILIRSIYRLVEHLGNTEVELEDIESLKTLSPILRYEWFFYVFEATLMLINSFLWNIWNPGRYLPRRYHVYLAQDGVTELEGEEMSDDRPLLAQAVHVLTFGILFRKKKVAQRFHQLNDYPGANRQG